MLLRWCVLGSAFVNAIAADYNVVDLDNATFPLLVGNKLPVFVRFDKEYPYGEKADAFKAFAGVVAKSGKGIMIASIGIGTYGEKKNMDMAERFGFVQKGNLKVHFLFLFFTRTTFLGNLEG